MENKINFSNFFFNRRVSLGYTLRKFCRNKGYDVGYISRIENGLIEPPSSPRKLKALATALELDPETSKWVVFFDLASACKGRIPQDLTKNSVIINLLPAFYRTLRKEQITQQDINKLITLIKDGKSGKRTSRASARLCKSARPNKKS